ncbi:MAG TPA: polyhydroxyalkanoate granule-associated phasin [Ramlibacter sp.]|jgi:hypothetical protein|nr:polyhydroxyalkanoate granule-associated phasin [Ramlibacter sp.]
MFDPFTLWADLALRTTEMLVASSQVIGTRVGQMARAGANPSPRDVKEFTLMGSEKVKAATQSGMAVAAGLQSANYQLMARGWQQWVANLAALGALASSRTMGEALSRQSRLFHSLARSGHTHSRLSSDTARLLSAALEPVHGAATANARRLARTRKGP